MKVGQYRFLIDFPGGADLPAYKGSLFRGAFGRAFKKTVCAVRKQPCESCLVRRRCLYVEVFESGLDGSGRSLPLSTPPYVLEPPLTEQRHFHAGEGVEVGLTLFGEVNDALAFFVYAFEAMGRLGLGSGIPGKGARFTVAGVRAHGREIYDPGNQTLDMDGAVRELPGPSMGDSAPGRMKCIWNTPLRVKSRNELLVNLPFKELVRAMVRRAQTLCSSFDNAPPSLDVSELLKHAESVVLVEDRLRWKDLRRYSSRQRQAMIFGGLVGEAVYAGDIGIFLPLLEFCALAHVGKQTTFGLGHFDYQWAPA